MKCPHCKIGIFIDNDKIFMTAIKPEYKSVYLLSFTTCPSCNKLIVFVGHTSGEAYSQAFEKLERYTILSINAHPLGRYDSISSKQIVYPEKRINSTRKPCPEGVPGDIAEDYTEACSVLSLSPKASAALSRRCLQHFLREVIKVTPSDLFKEIQQVIDSGKLPSYITEAIDAVRNIGNFAAHPIKSQTTGEIIAVEPQEAEWNLDVLEAPFDFYYVQPNELKRKKEALNIKLQDAGKPPMK